MVGDFWKEDTTHCVLQITDNNLHVIMYARVFLGTETVLKRAVHYTQNLVSILVGILEDSWIKRHYPLHVG